MAHVFDEATQKRFHATTGGADIKSEDKQFHMLPGDPHVWAVASHGTIGREYDALRAIAARGGATVLAGQSRRVMHNGSATDAYPMQWVAGSISSKSQRAKFLAAMQEHGNSPELRESIAQFQAVAAHVDVQDFQVLFNPATRRLVANDPRGARPRTGSGVTFMEGRLQEWSNAMGMASHGSASGAAASPSAAAASASATAPVRSHHSHSTASAAAAAAAAADAGPRHDPLDAIYHDAWRNRFFEFAPADQLHTMFSPAQHRSFLQGQTAMDTSGNAWNFAHHSASENRVYMRVGRVPAAEGAGSQSAAASAATASASAQARPSISGAMSLSAARPAAPPTAAAHTQATPHVAAAASSAPHGPGAGVRREKND